MAEPRPGKRRFVITLEAKTTEIPTEIRLRRALKCLLRSFGFRCVSATESPPNPAGAQNLIKPDKVSES